MKLWKDMNCNEQCELKAAYAAGKTIQSLGHHSGEWRSILGKSGPSWLDNYAYRVKPEAKSAEMKLWRDLTDTEKGALLLAYHKGKVIQFFSRGYGVWVDCADLNGPAWAGDDTYRVKPEPTMVELTGACYSYGWVMDTHKDKWCSHVITFNLIDGEPDCRSVKMEKLK